MHFVTRDNLFSLLDTLNKGYDVFVPVKKAKTRYYTRYLPSSAEREPASGREPPSPAPAVVFGEVRAFEPLKGFFTMGREKVAESFKADLPRPGSRPAAIVGAKACDLKGFKIQDLVFRGEEFDDPIYRRARERNLVISADCTCAIDTCFCLALDVRPHPQSDFDLNLSEVSGGFVVEAGSGRGEAIVASNASLFTEAGERALEERDDQRERVAEQVEGNLKANGVPNQRKFEGIIEKNYKSSVWEEEARTCVECAACNAICPTCHCFLLYDQSARRQIGRYRVWDSCMIKDFAKVAAGVNPRERLWMRLRNRFEKKFGYFPETAGVYACTGCGRCITACPAKIDIRRVLGRLVKDAARQPV